MAKLGIKWDRGISPGSYFRWSLVEPQDDQFVWYDDEVDLANSRGVQVLATVGTNDDWPAWADDAGKPNLGKWQEFVGQLAAHYQGRVAAWEIWNEANHSFTPDFYAKMVKRAAEAVRASDPGAKVVAFGGSASISWDLDVISRDRAPVPGVAMAGLPGRVLDAHVPNRGGDGPML